MCVRVAEFSKQNFIYLVAIIILHIELLLVYNIIFKCLVHFIFILYRKHVIGELSLFQYYYVCVTAGIIVKIIYIRYD